MMSRLTKPITLLAVCLATACSPNTKGAPKQAELGELIHTAQPGAKSQGTIMAGRLASGELESTDAAFEDGTHYDVWYYEGREGEQLIVTMTSDLFDAYVLLGDAEGELIAENDDGAGGLDARISMILPVDGEYVIVANSVEAGDTGAYALRLEVTTTNVAGLGAGTDWGTLYPGGGDPSGRYALLVGIDDYPGIGNDLRGPVSDAGIIRDVLIDGYGFRPENVVLLKDANAHREHIAHAFVRHLGQAGPAGVAVFYYSGHGLQMDGNHGTADFEPDGKDEALAVWGDGESSIILDDELGSLIGRLTAGRTLILLDACYSGTGTRGGPGQGKRVELEDLENFVMPRVFLAGNEEGGESPIGGDLLAGPENHMLLSAASDDEVAYTASGWPRFGGTASVFTYYLASELLAATSETTFEQLGADIRSQAVEYSVETYGAQQTPQVEGARRTESVRAFLGGR